MACATVALTGKAGCECWDCASMEPAANRIGPLGLFCLLLLLCLLGCCGGCRQYASVPRVCAPRLPLSTHSMNASRTACPTAGYEGAYCMRPRQRVRGEEGAAASGGGKHASESIVGSGG